MGFGNGDAYRHDSKPLVPITASTLLQQPVEVVDPSIESRFVCHLHLHPQHYPDSSVYEFPCVSAAASRH